MILRILKADRRAVRALPLAHRVGAGAVAGPPRLVEDETRLVGAGIHSRRTAAGLLDVMDPDMEWERWRAEESEVGKREM